MPARKDTVILTREVRSGDAQTVAAQARAKGWKARVKKGKAAAPRRRRRKGSDLADLFS